MSYLLGLMGGEEILKEYFQSTDLYMGLWTNATITIPDTETTTLSTYSDEITDMEYDRILIPKENWSFDKLFNRLYLNTPIVFNSKNYSWDILGYFIATTSDNSGKLILIEKLDDKEFTLEQSNYLSINPKITLY